MVVERPLNDAEARALARLGAAAAGGDDERLRAAFPAALEHATPADVEELLLQTYLFAGFPRAINAFFAWQGWAVTHGAARPRAPVEPYDAAAWRARGEALCRIVYGDGYEALQERLARLHPALAEWTLVEGYGKVLGRPGPGAARREIAAVGALVALGAARQLRAHLLGAVHAGVPAALVAGAARAAAAEWSREAWTEECLVRFAEEGV
jgi:4-carboxymuconolactone decarboxylase